ncbi:MAG: alpha/beta hydrolase [Candidatus Velthaea sp.]
MARSAIVGRYMDVELHHGPASIYWEEAGRGRPVLCLHTAGADSRQWRHLLSDDELAERFRFIAFDLPFHGRSEPLGEWWTKDYRLTTDAYVEWILAVIDALKLDRPIVIGCSMGAAIVLRLASRHADRIGAVVGLGATAQTSRRYHRLLDHPGIDATMLAATYTLGLCAPQSPARNARENMWYYLQGAPGVYAGDIAFFDVEWDERAALRSIDTDRTPVALVTGEYDYAATPQMAQDAAAQLRDVSLEIVPELGHFPMIENYPHLRPALVRAFDHVAPRADPAHQHA